MYMKCTDCILRLQAISYLRISRHYRAVQSIVMGNFNTVFIMKLETQLHVNIQRSMYLVFSVVT